MGSPDVTGNTVGEASIYTRATISAIWLQEALLFTGSVGLGEGYGSSVSLSGDGGTAVVGAPQSSQGQAFVFERSGATWPFSPSDFALTPTGISLTAGDAYGTSVSVSTDGLIIAGQLIRCMITLLSFCSLI